MNKLILLLVLGLLLPLREGHSNSEGRASRGNDDAPGFVAFDRENFARGLGEARNRAVRRFPTAPEVREVVADVSEIELSAGGLRQPIIRFFVGFPGGGKTTSIRATLEDIPMLDRNRIFRMTCELGAVTLPITQIIGMSPPNNGSRMINFSIFDEFFNLARWSDLTGIIETPSFSSIDRGGEHRFDGDSRSDGETRSDSEARDRPRTTTSFARPRRTIEEVFKDFYRTEKGRRIEMWMQLHDILGDGHLNLTRESITAQMDDSSRTPQASFRSRLLQYNRLNEDIERKRRDLEENSDKIAKETSNYHATQTDINVRQAAIHDLTNEYNALNTEVQNRVRARAAAARNTTPAPNATGNETEARPRPRRTRVPIIEAEDPQAAEVRERLATIQRLQREVNEINTRFQAMAHEIQRLNQRSQHIGQEITQLTAQISPLEPIIMRAIQYILLVDPEYLRPMGINLQLGVETIYDEIMKDPVRYFETVRSGDTTLPPTIGLNFANTVMYFLGNPPSVIEEYKRRFRELNPKTPDALLELIQADEDTLNEKLRKEIAEWLGLDIQVIVNDPEIPDVIKPVIIGKIGALRSRLAIDSIAFKLPLSNAQYTVLIDSWLAEIREMMRISNAGHEVILEMTPETREQLFNATVDALGQVRETSRHFHRVISGIVSEVALWQAAITREERRPIRIKVEIVAQGTMLRLNALVLDATSGQELTTLATTVRKPQMTWQTDTEVLPTGASAMAIHQAAQIVAGLHYFGALPVDRVSMDFRSETVIGRTAWMNPSANTEIFVAQVATLLAGPMIELLGGDPYDVRTLSRLGSEDLASAERLVTRFLQTIVTAESDHARLFGENTGTGMGPAHRYILMNRLRLPSARLAEADVIDAIKRELLQVLKENFPLIREFTLRMREHGALGAAETRQVLETVRTQLGTEAPPLSQLNAITEIIANPSGSSNRIRLADPEWIPNTAICEELARGDAMRNVSLGTVAAGSSGAAPAIRDTAARAPADLRAVMREFRGLMGDLRGFL